MATTTYSFLDVNAGFSGPTGSFSLKQGASEEGIKVTMREAKDILDIAADGRPMHSLRADNSATITVTLFKNSPVNALLSDAYNAQRGISALWGQNNITITNLMMGDLINASSVAFSKQPEIANGEKGGTYTWEFLAGDIHETFSQAVI